MVCAVSIVGQWIEEARSKLGVDSLSLYQVRTVLHCHATAGMPAPAIHVNNHLVVFGKPGCALMQQPSQRQLHVLLSGKVPCHGAEECVPSVRVHQYHGSNRVRDATRMASDYDIIVTTYQAHCLSLAAHVLGCSAARLRHDVTACRVHAARVVVTWQQMVTWQHIPTPQSVRHLLYWPGALSYACYRGGMRAQILRRGVVLHARTDAGQRLAHVHQEGGQERRPLPAAGPDQVAPRHPGREEILHPEKQPSACCRPSPLLSLHACKDLACCCSGMVVWYSP